METATDAGYDLGNEIDFDARMRSKEEEFPNTRVMGRAGAGTSATPLSRAYGRAVENETHEEERDNASGIFEGDASTSIRLTPGRLAGMLKSEGPPIVLDVRTRSQYEADRTRIPGAVRVAPDQVDEWVQNWKGDYPDSQAEGQRIVAYCT